jgi:NADPH-dependent F420 reductase
MSTDTIKTIAVLGGTGDLGGGLALRWARAGYRILIGSRDAAKAQAAAAALAAAVPGAQASGHTNREAAAAADLVVLAIPFSHHAPILAEIQPVVGGKIVVDTTVPLVPPKVMRVQLPPEGCAAIATQKVLADATVVSAFQNVAADLLASDAKPDCDVLIAGDQPAAREVVAGRARKAGFRAFHAGPLANSAAMEALTSVLIFLNRQHPGGHAGIRITGLDTGGA